jgi:hypothetical protein
MVLGRQLRHAEPDRSLSDAAQRELASREPHGSTWSSPKLVAEIKQADASVSQGGGRRIETRPSKPLLVAAIG